MPINGFSIGRDVSIDVNMPQGPVRFSNITKFDPKPIYTSIESKGIDGINRFGEIPSGWQISIEIDRANANMDLVFAGQEAAYYAGQALSASQITQTITEPDGSMTTWRFIGLALKYDDAGSWEGDKKVTQKCSGKASMRVAV